MKPDEPLVDECIASLVEAFAVGDVWSLDPRAAKECKLDEDVCLVVMVGPGAEASEIEGKARELIRAKFPNATVGIHVFSPDAMFRTPRPLLVKMAFTGGHHVYCG